MRYDIKFRLEDLQTQFRLLEQGVGFESVNLDSIEIVDPAKMAYSMPEDGARWKKFKLGGQWGSDRSWACFRGRVTVPEHWRGHAIEFGMAHTVHFDGPIDCFNEPTGPEGQVFIDGVRVGAIDQRHHHIRHPFKAGRNYDIRAVFFAGQGPCRHALSRFGLTWVDTAAQRLYYDLKVLLQTIEQHAEHSHLRERLMLVAQAAFAQLDLRDLSMVPASFWDKPDHGNSRYHASVKRAQQALDEVRESIGINPERPRMSAVGHAHIDLAWLWPGIQAQHKCVRTFATQCRLLDQYPDWYFNQSSPQAYLWIERNAPDLYKRIRKHVQSGRWEAEGAFWVECDTNLTGGESLVRQLLYGKRYFLDRFGIDSEMLWLPDVFGYSGALPQLLRLAGVKSFVTAKISWSQYNRFPHDTFRWRGIDGSEIPTHFITTPWVDHFFHYNARMTPAEIRDNWQQYRGKHLLTEPLMSFGWGDGGGGPTEEMLEFGARLSNPQWPSELPLIRMEKASELMRRVREQAAELPVWDGELYLEYHRGTYTTQAWLKRANRKNEILLHNLEWLAVLAGPVGYKLDKAALDGLWHDLLYMQFHDILPGSSTSEVYETECRGAQQRISDQAGTMLSKAAASLAAAIDTRGMKQPVVLFNTLSWDRTEPIKLDRGQWIDGVSIPAGGWRVIDAAAVVAQTSTASSPGIEDGGRRLENDFWRIELDDQGRISQLFDKRANRDVLAPEQVANQWQLFMDRPMGYDAWDIDDFYKDHPLPEPVLKSLRMVEQGVARSAVELDWEIQPARNAAPTRITQRMAIYRAHPRIDFETWVDWREHHTTLKVAFPVDVRTTQATYQIQFGHLQRPTHRNTDWDVARFEVCAHQFADLSEHGYGVALLNDCKYGHDALDGVLRLTCLRSAQNPDTRADQGEQHFVYSLLPHTSSFQEAGVVQAAAELNNPVLVVRTKPTAGRLPASQGWFSKSGEAILLDTLKPAEDGRGVIARFYECHGSHATALISFTQPPTELEAVDLIERETDEVPAYTYEPGQGALQLQLRPFEVATFRLIP